MPRRLESGRRCPPAAWGPQPKGGAGAGVESNSEGPSRTLVPPPQKREKLDKEKLEPNPMRSQDIKALQTLNNLPGPKAEQDHPRIYSGPCGAHSGVLFGKVFSQKRLSAF